MFIISFGLMQLSQVVAVSFLTPVFAVVWDIVLFRSKTTWRQLLPALLGLIGVWFVLRPGLDVPLIHAIVPFLASILLWFYLSAAKWLKPSESTLTVVFYFSSIGILASLPMLVFNWTTPDYFQMSLLLVGGVCGGLGIGMRNFAYRNAPAIFVGPFEYSGIIWAAVFGYLLFGDRPSLSLLLGTIAIIFLYILQARYSRT